MNRDLGKGPSVPIIALNVVLIFAFCALLHFAGLPTASMAGAVAVTAVYIVFNLWRWQRNRR